MPNVANSIKKIKNFLCYIFLKIYKTIKEVIQPHLPVRLPCYDFTLIASPALGALFLFRLKSRLWAKPTLVV